MYAQATRMPPQDFAFRAKSLRGQKPTVLTKLGRSEQYTIDSMVYLMGNEVDRWYRPRSYGGLLIYSFTCMIISLTDLVSMRKVSFKRGLNG